jgi:hypothetical protein
MNGNTAHRFLHWERLAFRQCLRRRDLLPPCGGAGTIARGDGQAGPAEPERLLEAWWSKGKLGGISTTCDQAAPGYAPNTDEYWYARYLLTGKHQGFSDAYIPRFTLNDGS